MIFRTSLEYQKTSTICFNFVKICSSWNSFIWNKSPRSWAVATRTQFPEPNKYSPEFPVSGSGARHVTMCYALASLSLLTRNPTSERFNISSHLCLCWYIGLSFRLPAISALDFLRSRRTPFVFCITLPKMFRLCLPSFQGGGAGIYIPGNQGSFKLIHVNLSS